MALGRPNTHVKENDSLTENTFNKTQDSQKLQMRELLKQAVDT